MSDLVEKMVRDWEAKGNVGLPPGVHLVITRPVTEPPCIPGDEVLTVATMAAWLRVHPVTIRHAAATGQIPGRRVGRSWRFLRSEINKYLKGPRP